MLFLKIRQKTGFYMENFVNHALIKENTIESRQYQEDIVSSVLEKGNSLVVAPTALGKTILAVVIGVKRIEKFPESKILILAPTRPLALQHQKSFFKFTKIKEDEICCITGTIKPKERKEMFENSKIICSTPQCIANDVKKGLISLENVSLCVFDEAHRAIGNYSYVFVSKNYSETAKNPLVVALTASPGWEKEKIQKIADNLFIKNIEVRTHKDKDVRDYVKEINVEYVPVELPAEFTEIIILFKQYLAEKASELHRMGVSHTANLNFFSRKNLLELQKKVSRNLAIRGRRQPSLFAAASKIAAMMNVMHSLILIETQGVDSLNKYFFRLEQKILNKEATKAVKGLMNDDRIKKAVQLTEKLKREGIEHPKIQKLRNILEDYLSNNPNSRVLVFNHYRDSIMNVYLHLKDSKIIKAREFVGQADKGTVKGMTQDEQSETISKFRQGEYNVLLATSLHPDEFLIIKSPKGEIDAVKIGEFVERFLGKTQSSKPIRGWKVLSFDGENTEFKEVTYVHRHLRKNNVIKTRFKNCGNVLVTENHSLISFGKDGRPLAAKPERNLFVHTALEAENTQEKKILDLAKEFWERSPKAIRRKIYCTFNGLTQARIREMKSEQKLLKVLLKQNGAYMRISEKSGLDVSTVANVAKRLEKRGLVAVKGRINHRNTNILEKGQGYLIFLDWFFRKQKYYKMKYRISLDDVVKAPKSIKNFSNLNIETAYGKTKLPQYLELNEALASFLGWFVSEGNLVDSNKKGSILLSSIQKPIQKIMKKAVVSGLGINPRISKKGVIVEGRLISYLVKYILKAGDSTINKSVPPKIFSAPNRIKWAFLKAYSLGDGHFDKKQRRLVLTTISRKLATGLVFLLRQLNVKKITVREELHKKKNWRNVYRVHISEALPFFLIPKKRNSGCYFNAVPRALEDPPFFEKFANKFHILTSNKKIRLTKSPNNKTSYDYIKSIEKIKNQPRYVYDLSVKKNENFYAGPGLICAHNSVAEEGLDLPNCDLVILFEPVPSEIRTIQRRGRTGRLDEGRVIILMAKGTRDEAYYWVAYHKEKKMHKILSGMQKDAAFDEKSENGEKLEKKPKTVKDKQTKLFEFK